MSVIAQRFARLSTEDAPGQEARHDSASIEYVLRGERLVGTSVDFSHGDVGASAFAPTPGSLEKFVAGVIRGGAQAYSEYRGHAETRGYLSAKLADFTGRTVSAENEIIITPGTQAALFLSIASAVSAGDKVAVVQPDYFANRKVVEFLGAAVAPVSLDYHGTQDKAGLNLSDLERAFESGAKTFVFSNPNNPTGIVYSRDEIDEIAQLASRYNVTVIVDQLYSRLIYAGCDYPHLRAHRLAGDNVVTIMGPSKMESLSGYRLGVAFGGGELISRMERLQAIVVLRAPGYSQAVLDTWFSEPAGWIADRIARHQSIRDDILQKLRGVDGLSVRAPEGGSYVFPRLPNLTISNHDFVRALRHQASVTVTPGTEFSPHCIDSVRLNFSQNHKAAVEAVERLAILIDRYRQ